MAGDLGCIEVQCYPPGFVSLRDDDGSRNYPESAG